VNDRKFVTIPLDLEGFSVENIYSTCSACNEKNEIKDSLVKVVLTGAPTQLKKVSHQEVKRRFSNAFNVSVLTEVIRTESKRTRIVSSSVDDAVEAYAKQHKVNQGLLSVGLDLLKDVRNGEKS
jgi:hypothetical protein